MTQPEETNASHDRAGQALVLGNSALALGVGLGLFATLIGDGVPSLSPAVVAVGACVIGVLFRIEAAVLERRR
ncbi:hypothetical protein ACFFV7_47435 [Nonomuraea spiralis]|uniref:Uncharacterized protein n=1 Tax=Nonomuraea spiralis TaxID=46182 RepID=A0ABV5IYR8_9ACTN|nr:hypothetical protein [Nonomuraea spiralis]GGT45216.1 hypothetical protein GCM10010176_105670 [Nonomuraea spiralis]